MMGMRGWLVGLLLGCGLPFEAAAIDRLVLRDGSVRRGSILSDVGESYTLRDAVTRSTEPVRKNTVRFAIYGEGVDVGERLGLDGLRGRVADGAPRAIRVLPAEAFGREIIEAARAAKKYIYVATYNLSGVERGGTREFFDVLEERARAGVKVYVLVSAGSRTAAGVKIRVLNTAEALADSGVQVRFITGSKVMHKKLVIVDTRLAFVGSSNLTGAGVGGNIELSIATEAPGFVAEAVEDFRSMIRRAKPPHKVTF